MAVNRAVAALNLKHENIFVDHNCLSPRALGLKQFLLSTFEGAQGRRPDLPLGRILCGVIRALQYLHHHRVVHGCVCPAAIRINEGRVVLTGFATAEVLTPGVDAMPITLNRFLRILPANGVRYVAPELLANKAQPCLSPACDLWSVGALAYWLAYFQHPGSWLPDDEAFTRAITSCDYNRMFVRPTAVSSNVGVNRWLRAIMTGCLTDPWSRRALPLLIRDAKHLRAEHAHTNAVSPDTSSKSEEDADDGEDEVLHPPRMPEVGLAPKVPPLPDVSSADLVHEVTLHERLSLLRRELRLWKARVASQSTDSPAAWHNTGQRVGTMERMSTPDMLWHAAKQAPERPIMQLLAPSELHIACENGDERQTKQLLKLDRFRSLINSKDETGWTSLHNAARGGHYGCCIRLLRAGADPSIRNEDGNTALHYLARLSHSDVSPLNEVVDLLVKKGADMNPRNCNQEVPLHQAAFRGAEVSVQCLLRHGADVNARTFKGETPLLFAVQSCHRVIIKKLMDAGADVMLRCDQFGTPIDLASSMQQPDVVAVLQTSPTYVAGAVLLLRALYDWSPSALCSPAAAASSPARRRKSTGKLRARRVRTPSIAETLSPPPEEGGSNEDSGSEDQVMAIGDASPQLPQKKVRKKRVRSLRRRRRRRKDSLSRKSSSSIALTLRRDDVLVLVKEYDSKWYVARHQGSDKVGLVHSSLVEHVTALAHVHAVDAWTPPPDMHDTGLPLWPNRPLIVVGKALQLCSWWRVMGDGGSRIGLAPSSLLVEDLEVAPELSQLTWHPNTGFGPVKGSSSVAASWARVWSSCHFSAQDLSCPETSGFIIRAVACALKGLPAPDFGESEASLTTATVVSDVLRSLSPQVSRFRSARSSRDRRSLSGSANSVRLPRIAEPSSSPGSPTSLRKSANMSPKFGLKLDRLAEMSIQEQPVASARLSRRKMGSLGRRSGALTRRSAGNMYGSSKESSIPSIHMEMMVTELWWNDKPLETRSWDAMNQEEFTRPPLIVPTRGYCIEAGDPLVWQLPSSLSVVNAEDDIAFYKEHMAPHPHTNIVSRVGKEAVVVSVLPHAGGGPSLVLERSPDRMSRSCVCGDRPVRLVEERMDLMKGREVVDPKLVERLLHYEVSEIVKTYKFGVLLWKENQSENDAFANTGEACNAWHDFLSFLGDRIRLKGWTRFRGGLNTTNDATGEESIFAEVDDLQLMFHVSTMLPLNVNDTQQIERKRHLGNDVALIVFKEGNQAFDASHVRSQFNHAWIVIEKHSSSTPEQTYYRVAVICKSNVSPVPPVLPHPPIFAAGPELRRWLHYKLVNLERSAMQAIDFRARLKHTRKEYLKSMYEEFGKKG